MQADSHLTIALDAMGGDFAPEVNIKGALMALEQTPGLRVALVGQRAVLTEALRKHHYKDGDSLEIIHAEEVISMQDQPGASVRKKKNSSIHVGLGLVREGKAQAFLSAGNSGAVMACALMELGRLAGVERPAILVKLPTAEGYSILLDAGANVDSKVHHLSQFALMGHVYAQMIEGITSPRVGVLSNASESHKGNELTRELDRLLRENADLNYVGCVEGFDLFRGTADVIICDGFVGNVVLKVSEGLAKTCVRWFRKKIREDWPGMVGLLLMRRLVRQFRDTFDYEPYGAAPLLGINGMVLISHGGSSEVAIRNGLLTAKRGVEQDFLAKISRHFQTQEKDPAPKDTE